MHEAAYVIQIKPEKKMLQNDTVESSTKYLIFTGYENVSVFCLFFKALFSLRRL